MPKLYWVLTIQMANSWTVLEQKTRNMETNTNTSENTRRKSPITRYLVLFSLSACKLCSSLGLSTAASVTSIKWTKHYFLLLLIDVEGQTSPVGASWPSEISAYGITGWMKQAGTWPKVSVSVCCTSDTITLLVFAHYWLGSSLFASPSLLYFLTQRFKYLCQLVH